MKVFPPNIKFPNGMQICFLRKGFFQLWICFSLSSLCFHSYLSLHIARRDGMSFSGVDNFVYVVMIFATCFFLISRRKNLELLFETISSKTVSSEVRRRLISRRSKMLFVILLAYFTYLLVVVIFVAYSYYSRNTLRKNVAKTTLFTSVSQAPTWLLFILFCLRKMYYVSSCQGLFATYVAFYCIFSWHLEAVVEEFVLSIQNYRSPRHCAGKYVPVLRRNLDEIKNMIQECNNCFETVVSLWYGIAMFSTCFGLGRLLQNLSTRDVLLCFTVVVYLTPFTVITLLSLFAARIAESLNQAEQVAYGLLTCEESLDDIARLRAFLSKFKVQPNGLSIGGCSIITKASYVSLFGVVLTYAVVVIQMSDNITIIR